MKVIAFPFAGGNKYSYQKFSQNNSNFVVIEYPGRGKRIKEELIIDINSLIEDLLPQIKNEINSCDDYIIYGHSMGGLIGYLICHKIEQLGIKKPLKFVVSGRNPPFFKKGKMISCFLNEEFWKEVTKMGGIPDEVSNHPDLIDFYLPILKSDFTAVENYKHVLEGKLNIPIDVFYGSDEGIKAEDIIGWKDMNTHEVTINQMIGNHFFIFDHIDFFKDYFLSTIKQ
ncbi:thioesterase II family protein [Flavobacterium sp.]|uniref:thioesterase II family protein n=1 Tax=Flavobacterium sp. TaxID=239 RepID=UPI003D0DEC37